MFDTPSNRRVALAALVALATVFGAVASAPATARTHALTAETGVSTTATPGEAENVSASFVRGGDALATRVAENRTVEIETNAEPGTELTLELRENGNFVREAVAPVSEDGRASVAFDHMQMEAGTEVTVTVRYDGATLAEASGTVGDATATPTTYNESGVPSTVTTTAETATTAQTTGSSANDGAVPGFGASGAVAAVVAGLALARRA